MALEPSESVLYEPDEGCSLLVSVGVGLQGVLMILAPTVLFVAIVVQAADQGERYLSWSVFAALLITGAMTALQAGRIGRFGAGHVLITGTAPSFIAVSLIALAEGGPAMLASLVVVTSISQFALAAWLPLLRRIITPVVSGIVIMLVAVMVIPLSFDRLEQVPEGAPPAAGPTVAVVTLVVATLLGLRASGALRLWSPLIGIVAGCAVAAFFGMYDFQRIVEASWIGIPEIGLPGFDLGSGMEFWSLLPMFLVVNLVTAIKTVGGGVVIQRVARRKPRVTDFRVVQGAVNANGLGALLSGIAGTLPTITYDASSVSLINFTGVASRSVGYAIGVILVGLALLPKATALLLTIPSTVSGTYLLMIMGLLLVEGMRTVVQDGLDHRKALVVGVSLSIGVGLQNKNVFADLLGGAWGTLLGNGMMVGALAAILMTSLIELTSPQRRRLRVELDISALPKIDEFLRELASRIGWNDTSTTRLRYVGEEALSSLLRDREDSATENVRRLTVVARPAGGTVELEFLAVFENENLEDRLAYLSEQAEVPEEHEMSLRILRHYASSVRHRRYHGIDIITMQVEGSL